MAELPRTPTVQVQVPTSTQTQGTLPVTPGIVVFPVAGAPDAAALLVARHDGSSYPLRNTITTDSTRVVVWIGPVPPAVDSDYALDNVDIYFDTTA
jgi:hypothetical protein